MGFGNAAPERPYTRTIKWKSEGARFTEYDKEKDEDVTFEVEWFVVLEELFSVSGYHAGMNKGIWSNECLENNEVLTVKAGNDVIATGTWRDIKEQVKGMGGKYTSVVIALTDQGEIVRFLFSGSSLNGWIDKRFSPMQSQCGVEFTGSVEGTTGATTYNVPRFARYKLTDKQKQDAMDKWRIVDAWLKGGRDVEAGNDELAQVAAEEAASTPYSEEIPF